MLAPSSTWELIFGRAGFKPAFLVSIDVGGGTVYKFLKATSPRYGYFNNVHKVTRRPSSLNLTTGEQTVAALSLEFIADDAILDVIFNHYLEGKDVSVKIGADLDSDTAFLEADFLDFTTGIISKHRRKGGIVVIDCHDPRSVMWDRPGVTQTVPSTGFQAGDVGQVPLYRGEGCATRGVKELLSVGMAAVKINAASFDAVNNPKTGHLVIDRRRIPDPNNYTHLAAGQRPDDYGEGPPTSDRRIRNATPASQLVEQVLQVLRSAIIVHEDGVAKLKEFDAAESSVYTFTKEDIVPGSVDCSLDHKRIITSAEVYTAFEGLESEGGPVHRMRFRSDDTGAIATWEFSDGTDRKADWTLTDDFFSSMIVRDPWTANVGAADTVITGIVRENDNFTGQGRNSPLAVDATHPMYVYIFGTNPAGESYPDSPGEIIKVTKVITNADGSFTFGDGGSPCVRGQFGTTARQHGRAGIVSPGDQLTSITSDVFMCDITAVVRAVQEVVGQYKNGVDVLSFKTPFNTAYKVQLGDVVIVETDDFISKAQRGLPVGNTITWRCAEKDADGEGMEIAWRFERLYPASSHTANVGNNAWGRLHGNAWGLNPGLSGGGWRDALPFEGSTTHGQSTVRAAGELIPAFISGGIPQAAVGLQATIPAQTIGTSFGVLHLSQRKWTLTASRDTYFDFKALPGGRSEWYPTPVLNGAAAPAIPAGCMRAFKVVTNATDVLGPATDLRNKASHDVGINVRDGLGADDYKRTKNVQTLPAASTAGQLMVERDTDMVFRDTGTEWKPLRGSGTQEAVQAIEFDAMFELFSLTSDRRRRFVYANDLLPFFDRGTAINGGAVVANRWGTYPMGTLNAANYAGGFNVARQVDQYTYDGSAFRDEGVNLPTTRYAGAAGGLQNAGVIAGGVEAAVTNATATSDGYAWTGKATLPAVRSDQAGVGRQNAFLSAGGWTGAAASTAVYRWNGETWDTPAALSQARYAPAGCGRVDSAMVTCGHSGAAYSTTHQAWNGYAWANVGSAGSSNRAHHGCWGSATRAMIASGDDGGGVALNYLYARSRWNGFTWSAQVDGTVIFHHTFQVQGVGTASAALTAHGADDGATNFGTHDAEKYVIENPVDLVLFGIGDDTLIDSTLQSGDTFAFTKKFEGVAELIPACRSGFDQLEQSEIALIHRQYDPGAGVWAATGSMSTDRSRFAAAGTRAAGLVFGGRDNTGPAWHSSSEEFDGSSYSAGGALTAARNYHVGFGRQNAAVAAFGTPTDTIASATAWAQTYDGSTWTNIGAPGGAARVAAGGAGVRNAAVAIGGLNTASARIATSEEWDGSAFAAGTSLVTATQESMVVGHLFAAFKCGGYDGDERRQCYLYNGSAWHEKASMLRRVYGAARFGSSSYAMVAGGTVEPFAGGAGVADTFAARWNGFTWAIAPVISSARHSGAGYGAGRHGVACGGETAGPVSVPTSQEFKTDLAIPTGVSGKVVARLFYDF